MSELNTGTSEEQSLNTQITDEIDVAEVMQVPIDDTLSNSGEAADAKAVGDALALKADKSEIQTQIKVNGQGADNQGLILIDATDIPMSSIDNTTIKAAIETVDSKTAEDIPVSDDEGAESIAEALANSGTRMADAIQMSATDERKVATAVNANTSALTALGETVTALQGRTAADILYQSGGTATIKSTVDALSGETVKSVNGETPDSVGNVAIDKVSYADNLWTEDNQVTEGEFLRRTTGGDISLSDGDATALKLMGNRVHTGFVAESITLTVTPYPRTAPAAISCSLDKATYLAYVTEAGTQVLTYDGEAWSESPALYGVTVTNTPIEDDEITLTWDGVNDPTMTVDAAPRTAPAAITATIDRDTFVAYVDESGTTTLYYTTEWSASPALYGITVTNDPVAGDQISVVYVKEVRGTITQANPTRIVATGWNLYESTNGYARVIPYSETYGYRIGGTYTSIAFADNAQGTGAETITPDENGLFTVDEPGYVIVTGGSTDTYILSTWSDWITEGSEGTYEAYTEHSITLSGIISTYLIAGLCRVGNVRDEIDFVAQKVVSRVQRLAYSAENRAMAAGTGRAYEFDENYIYLERETPTESSITIDQTYQMCEHGFEYFDGTTVAVYAELLYGTNLKDKLRRISAQTVPMTYGQTGTVADAITSANAAIAKVQEGLAYIVGNKNTTGNSLVAGQYVYVKGHSTIAEGLRKVTASISANGNITTNNTSACSEGGLLNSKIVKDWGIVTNSWLTSAERGDSAGAVTAFVGDLLIQLTIMTAGRAHSNDDVIAQIPSGYRPYKQFDLPAYCAGELCILRFKENGDVVIWIGASGTFGRIYASVTYIRQE